MPVQVNAIIIGVRDLARAFLVSSREEVDKVMATAAVAGAAVVKEAVAAQWADTSGTSATRRPLVEDRDVVVMCS